VAAAATSTRTSFSIVAYMVAGTHGEPGDDEFRAQAGRLLAALPGVRAVVLGGSRATGTAGPGSDWDFAEYYRGLGLDPQSCGRSAGRARSSRSAAGAAGCSTAVPG
jgi:hypothetical protein